MNKKIFIIGLILISFFYLFIRLYNLNNLIGFRLDQGVHLLETKAMFDSGKISLIGPMVTSKSFEGRNFFIGSNYYYVLGAIGLVGHWEPLIITRIFIFLEFIFYLFFIFWLKRKFNLFWALLIFLFVAISPYLIIHSRFFWNPHLLIPLAILTLFFTDKYFIKNQIKYLFLAAFFWGFAFACHYSAVFWLLWFLFILIKSRQWLNFRLYLAVFSGFILGNLPFFIFEIRHSFYNTKALFYVLLNSSQGGDLTSHYFIFSLLIFFIFVFLSLLIQIKKKFVSNPILILILIFLFLFQIKIFKDYSSLNSISGWNYPEQQKVVELILKDGCPQDFNVAATIQGDTRFYDLRYLLALRSCNPLPVEAYPQAQKLFLVAPVDRPVESETVWEVSSFKPFEIKQKTAINERVILFELDKATE
jgi:hypothetical protein